MLLAVIFATVIVLAAVADRLRWIKARMSALVVGRALLVVGLVGLRQLRIAGAGWPRSPRGRPLRRRVRRAPTRTPPVSQDGRAPGVRRTQDEATTSVDTWKFYDITHRDHVLCNPTTIAKIDELVGLLELPRGARVLDIACGKGELLIRIVERYGASAVGVDLSPYVVRELRERVSARIPRGDAELLEMDGAAYAGAPASFDLASCLGASWTFGGHAGTLAALAAWAKPGGQVLVGEPFWRREPDPAYLASSGMTRDQFGTHADNVETGVRLGLTPLYAVASDEDDFDHYEALQWRAADRFRRSHPDDPDVADLLDRVARTRHEYLTWGRETLGWSLYLFRT